MAYSFLHQSGETSTIATAKILAQVVARKKVFIVLQDHWIELWNTLICISLDYHKFDVSSIYF